MASFDEIFTSDLDANKKKSKMLFGKLLLSMRKNNKLRLYSLMSEVFDTELNENTLTLVIGDKSNYEMMNNKTDLESISNELSTIQSGLQLELKCVEKVKFDMFQFEERLKREFGKILTIK